MKKNKLIYVRFDDLTEKRLEELADLEETTKASIVRKLIKKQLQLDQPKD